MWDPNLGSQFGTPIKDPNLGPRFGTLIWDPDLGSFNFAMGRTPKFAMNGAAAVPKIKELNSYTLFCHQNRWYFRSSCGILNLGNIFDMSAVISTGHSRFPLCTSNTSLRRLGPVNMLPLRPFPSQSALLEASNTILTFVVVLSGRCTNTQ
jgi:hypothetical protein